MYQSYHISAQSPSTSPDSAWLQVFKQKFQQVYEGHVNQGRTLQLIAINAHTEHRCSSSGWELRSYLEVPKHLIDILVGGLEHQFYFPRNIGLLIIPIDFPIFQRGSNHQPVIDILLCPVNGLLDLSESRVPRVPQNAMVYQFIVIFSLKCNSLDYFPHLQTRPITVC